MPRPFRWYIPLIIRKRRPLMRVIIGYSMRSGSTLLSHILGGHSQIRAYSDISSSWALLRNMVGLR
ncbi:MAG: hypothetical protein ACOC15_03385, partial [Desulfovibrionales bacterium]